VRSSAEHLAGSVMFRLIGPPRGAYTGPYPTEAQALSAVATGTPVSAAMLASDQLIAAGVTLQIDPYWFPCQYQERRPEEPADPNVDATPRASLWQARCLIVRIPRDMPMGQAAADVYLIDVQRPELFALFWDRTPPPSPPSTK
jgi:hypothetical protein